MLFKNWIVIVGLICAIIVMALVSYKRSLLQLPRRIVIATGSTQGYYYKLGNEMKRIIEKEHPKVHVEILQTQGSFDNLKLIENRKADFAFYQNSGDTTTSIRSVANLYSEALHLIVKKPALEPFTKPVLERSEGFEGKLRERSSGITSIKQLKGKVVAIGSEGSGTRLMALEVLKHYGIELNDFDSRSYGLDELYATFSEDLQAAFVVMRVLAPGLLDLFRKHEDLQLASIEYSDALNMKYPSMCVYHIPKGAYRTDPPVPEAEFVTVAVKASIITNKHTPAFLVKYFAELIFKNEFRKGMNLIELNSDYAQVEEDFPLHKGAIAYYNRGKPTLYSIFVEGLRRSLVSLIALIIFIIGISLVLFRKSREKKQARHKRFADYAGKLQEQMGEVLVDEDTHTLIRRMQMLQTMQERIVNDNMTGMLENQECMILLQLSAALFSMSHFRILLSEKNS